MKDIFIIRKSDTLLVACSIKSITQCYCNNHQHIFACSIKLFNQFYCNNNNIYIFTGAHLNPPLIAVYLHVTMQIHCSTSAQAALGSPKSVQYGTHILKRPYCVGSGRLFQIFAGLQSD